MARNLIYYYGQAIICAVIAYLLTKNIELSAYTALMASGYTIYDSINKKVGD